MSLCQGLAAWEADCAETRVVNRDGTLAERRVRRRDRAFGRMTVDEAAKRQTTTFEQLSYSNMLTLTALVELLTEKGVLTKPAIVERIKKLQGETKVSA